MNFIFTISLLICLTVYLGLTVMHKRSWRHRYVGVLFLCISVIGCVVVGIANNNAWLLMLIIPFGGIVFGLEMRCAAILRRKELVEQKFKEA